MTVAFEVGGAVTATSTITDISTGADAKGSYVEIIASSGIGAELLYLILRVNAAATGSFLVDVATGSPGSEDIVIPDIFFEPGPASAHAGVVLYGPYLVSIASGTRYAIRAEGATATTISAELLLASERLPNLTGTTHVAYGIVTGASPKGTLVDPGGTANTKGAYSEVTSSFSATGEHVFLLIGNNQNSAMGDGSWLFDIAIGSPGSETDVISNLFILSDGTSDNPDPRRVGPLPANLFQGQRIAVRSQCTVIDAADRLLNVALSATQGTVATASGGQGISQGLHTIGDGIVA